MVHLILTGATGLVGSAVLHHMLGDAAVSRVSILSRRPVDMAKGHEDKVKVIIHKDFSKYDQAVLEQLKDAQGCVWALGVSQNDVDAKYGIHHRPIAKAFTDDRDTENTLKSHTITRSPPPMLSRLCIPTRPSRSSTSLVRAQRTTPAGSRPSSAVSRGRPRKRSLTMGRRRGACSTCTMCGQGVWIGETIPKSTLFCRVNPRGRDGFSHHSQWHTKT